MSRPAPVTPSPAGRYGPWNRTVRTIRAPQSDIRPEGSTKRTVNLYVRPARTSTAIDLPAVSPTTSLLRNTRNVPARGAPVVLHESVPVDAPTARCEAQLDRLVAAARRQGGSRPGRQDQSGDDRARAQQQDFSVAPLRRREPPSAHPRLDGCPTYGVIRSAAGGWWCWSRERRSRRRRSTSLRGCPYRCRS